MRRFLTAILTLGGLVACTAPADTGSEELATLAIDYSFSGFVPEATDCQTGWAEALWVDMSGAGGEQLLSQPCDDTPLEIANLPPGDWEVVVRSSQEEAPDSVWSTSAAQSVTLPGGQTTSISVELVCQDRCE